MITDPIADLLTRIRNAQRARFTSVRVRGSKMGEAILNVLKSEGFIESYERKKDREDKFDELDVVLKYYSSGEPMIRQARRVSKLGRRRYAGHEELLKVHSGLGVSLVSTSKGVISDREARKLKVGGEVLAYIS